MHRVLFALFALALVAPAPAAAADKKIEKLWKTKCQSCHGADGKAQTDKGRKMQIRDLSNAGWQAEVSDEDLKKAIKLGTKTEKDGVKKEMDAYGELTDEQLAGLVSIVRGLKK